MLTLNCLYTVCFMSMPHDTALQVKISYLFESKIIIFKVNTFLNDIFKLIAEKSSN
jgi:hypothetical protein